MNNCSYKSNHNRNLNPPEYDVVRKIDHSSRVIENYISNLQTTKSYHEFRNISCNLDNKLTELRSLYFIVRNKVSYQPLLALERRVSDIVKIKDEEFIAAQKRQKLFKENAMHSNHLHTIHDNSQSYRRNIYQGRGIYDQVDILHSEINDFLNSLDDCDNTDWYDEIESNVYERINELSHLAMSSPSLQGFVLDLESRIFDRIMNHRGHMNTEMRKHALEQLHQFNNKVDLFLYPIYEHVPYPKMSFPLGKESVSNFGLSITEKLNDHNDDESEEEVIITSPISIENKSNFQSDLSQYNRYESLPTSSSIEDQGISFIRYLFEPLVVKKHHFHDLVYDLRPLCRLNINHQEEKPIEPYIRYLFGHTRTSIPLPDFISDIKSIYQLNRVIRDVDSLNSSFGSLFHVTHERINVGSYEPMIRRLYQLDRCPNNLEEFTESISALFEQNAVPNYLSLSPIRNEHLETDIHNRSENFETKQQSSCTILHLSVSMPNIAVTRSICLDLIRSRLELVRIFLPSISKLIRICCDSSYDLIQSSRMFIKNCLFGISTDHLKGNVKRKAD